MSYLSNILAKPVAIALIYAVAAPAAHAGPASVNPETIHRKIVQRGTGKWVSIDLTNGTAVVGRIASLEEQSFGLQLDNYPEVTTIAYSNVLRVRSVGIGGKGLAIAIGAGVAGSVAIAVIATHEMNTFKNNQPTIPTLPTLP